MDGQRPGGEQVAIAQGYPVTASWLSRLRDAVIAARGWRRSMIALGSGAASVLALAPFFIAPVLLVTLPILVWLLDAASVGDADRKGGDLRAAFAIGWWFGFGYFFLGLFWVGEAFLVEPEIFGWLLPFAVTLMPAGLALFFGAATAAASRFWAPGLARIVLLAVAISATEYLRGHILTGFPWNVLGYALTWPLAMMQSAGLIGIYGLTLLTVVCLASPLVLAGDAAPGLAGWRRWRNGSLIAIIPVLALAAYGALRLFTPVADVPGVALRIVQPSVPQRDKWLREKQRQIFDEHLELSMTDSSGHRSGLGRVTHLVWPEAAMPFLPLNSPEALAEIGHLLGGQAQLITGALRVEDTPGRRDSAIPERATAQRKVFNSLLVLGSGGSLTALYDKIHLVPFGEYLPLQSVLEAIGLQQLTRLRGGFTPGPEPRPLLAVPGLPPLLGLVCYEAIFPAAIIQGSDRPGIIVNVTNDGWFGNTTGPRQHLHQTRVRAVEEGLPIIRAANNGISAMIDPYGRLLGSIPLNVRGTLDVALPAVASAPLYSSARDFLWAAAALVCLLVVLWTRFNKRGNRREITRNS